MERFQRLQGVTVAKSKEFVSHARIIAHSEEEDTSLLEAHQKQELAVQDQSLANEISYNQALIIDRERAIEEVQAVMNEVSAIFKDIGTLVAEQQGGFDNIAANVELAASRTRGAAGELRIAEDYRRRQPFGGCWGIFLAVLLTTILIAVMVSV